jgi:hypothetical protein
MFSDEERRIMYDAFEASLGPRPAALVMAHLPPTGWAELATRADVHALATALRGEMAELRAELRGEMSDLRVELKGEMAELRVELKDEIAKLRVELRGEIAAVDKRISGLVPRLVAANVATTVGLFGLVLGAQAVVA